MSPPQLPSHWGQILWPWQSLLGTWEGEGLATFSNRGHGPFGIRGVLSPPESSLAIDVAPSFLWVN